MNSQECIVLHDQKKFELHYRVVIILCSIISQFCSSCASDRWGHCETSSSTFVVLIHGMKQPSKSVKAHLFHVRNSCSLHQFSLKCCHCSIRNCINFTSINQRRNSMWRYGKTLKMFYGWQCFCIKDIYTVTAWNFPNRENKDGSNLNYTSFTGGCRKGWCFRRAVIFTHLHTEWEHQQLCYVIILW